MPKKQKPKRNKKSSSSSNSVSKRCSVSQMHPLSFRYINAQSFEIIENKVTNFLLDPLATVINIQRSLFEFENIENSKEKVIFVRSSLVYILILMGYFAQNIPVFIQLENMADFLVEEYTTMLESLLEKDIDFVKSEIAIIKIFHASQDCTTPTSLKNFLLSNVESNTLIDMIELSLNAPKIKQTKEIKKYVKETEQKYFKHFGIQKLDTDDFIRMNGEIIDLDVD